jgi:long-chain acyl-CoA synthetase
MPISRDVVRRAAAQPDRLAITGPGGQVMFGELAARARQQSAVIPEARMVLDDADPKALITGLLAADLAGVASIVVDHAWPKPVRDAAVAEADRLLATRPGGGSGSGGMGTADIRLVVFTSGSTGTPKPVLRTSTSWTHSYPTFSAITGVEEHDIVLIPGRMSGSLFLFGAIHALTMGAAVHLLPQWSARQAARAARECTVVHVVPSMLAALAAEGVHTQSKLRLAICAGAELAPDVEATVTEAGIEVVEYYGAAELSVVGVRTAGSPPGRFRAFPGVEVVVKAGRLWARSPYLAASTVRDADGFASVGDQAEALDEGRFLIGGRAGQAITSGGVTVQPDGVERVLRGLPFVADAAVVGMPHAELGEVVAAVIEPTDGASPGLGALRTAVAGSLPAAERPRRWYLIDRLPRTGSGKLAHAQVRAGLVDGTLEARSLT